MLNVGPEGMTPERGHLPCHPRWDGTMPQGLYVAWVSVSFQWAASLCLGDSLTMKNSSRSTAMPP